MMRIPRQITANHNGHRSPGGGAPPRAGAAWLAVVPALVALCTWAALPPGAGAAEEVAPGVSTRASRPSAELPLEAAVKPRAPGVALERPAPELAPVGPIPLYAPRELVARWRAGELTFVDVRQPEEYAERHLPGALNIPERELAARRGELPAETLLIPYCNMDFRGLLAAHKLRRLGFAQVGLMQERGLDGWRAQGLPTAGAAAGRDDAAARAELAQIELTSLAPAHVPRRYPPTGRVHRMTMEVANWYFHPNDLRVEAGDRIDLELISKEGDHSLVLPAFEVAVRIREGQRQRLRFVADQVGDHRFGSCEWDGTALHVMKGRLRVQAPAHRAGARSEAERSDAERSHPARRR